MKRETITTIYICDACGKEQDSYFVTNVLSNTTYLKKIVLASYNAWAFGPNGQGMEIEKSYSDFCPSCHEELTKTIIEKIEQLKRS